VEIASDDTDHGATSTFSRPKGVIKVKTIELNLIYTLLISIAVFFMGRALTSRVSVFKRFSIPAPVVGEGLVAVSRLEMMRR
jgi:hypothetical protein